MKKLESNLELIVKKIVLSLIVTLVSFLGFIPPAFATTGASGEEVVGGVDTGITWGAVKAGFQSPIGWNLDPGAQIGVQDIKISPTTGEVYFGGLFRNAIDDSGDYIIKYNPSTGIFSTLGSDGNGDGALKSGDQQATGIFSMVFDSSGVLYVTGDFNISETIYDVAKWNGTSWSAVGPDSTFQSVGSALNKGRSIAVDSQDNIYVAGAFFNIGGDPEADAIVKWDGASWSAIGGESAVAIGCEGNLTWCLNAVAIGKDDAIYVGSNGQQNLFGNAEADFIAKWNGANWVALGSNGAGDGAFDYTYIIRIAVDTTGLEDVVYVSTDAADLRGNPIGRFVKWDGNEWSQAGPNKITGASRTPVRAITLTSNGGVLVGGWFDEIEGNAIAKKLAYFDGTSMYALGKDSSNNPVFKLSNNIRGGAGVQALAIDADGRIYAGGTFEDANLDPFADFIAVSTATNLRPVGVSFSGSYLTRKSTNTWVGSQSITCPAPNPWVKEKLGFATNAKPVLVSAENTVGKTVTQSSYDALKTSGVLFDTVSAKVSTATETLPIYGCKDKLLSGKVNQPIQFIAGGYTLQSDAHGYINTSDLKWHDTNGVTLYTNTAAFMHTIKFTKTGKYVVVLTEQPDTSRGLIPTYGVRSVRFVITVN